MKRTLSLIGLLVVGLALLTNPSTGILSAAETDEVTAIAETTISGDPPVESAVDDLDLTSISTTTTTEADLDSGETAATTTSTTTATPETDTYSVVGSVEESRWGDFQVEAVFADGVLVDVTTLQLPTDRKSEAINDYAVPIYEEAVLDAQGTDIDAVSGATVTWAAFTASLQAALDEAGFAA